MQRRPARDERAAAAVAPSAQASLSFCLPGIRWVNPCLARLFDLPILSLNNPKASREARMNIHLHNSDIVMIIALALLGALLLALRFRPATWKGIVVEAVAANAAAIAAVVAFEMLMA
jgi:hypothetical protein